MHFWYNTWPDHGVPRDMRTGELNCHSILEMLADVRKFTKTLPNKPPTVVHCSAGIGRTGTYIGLDICTNQLLLTSQIDVVATVRRSPIAAKMGTRRRGFARLCLRSQPGSFQSAPVPFRFLGPAWLWPVSSLASRLIDDVISSHCVPVCARKVEAMRNDRGALVQHDAQMTLVPRSCRGCLHAPGSGAHATCLPPGGLFSRAFLLSGVHTGL